jgi:hypothetical protein
MAPPPPWQPENEDEPTEWLKGRRVAPPWKFFANLYVGDVKSMRRIAEYLNHYLLYTLPAVVSGRMNWVERYEARRMIDETKKYEAGEDMNELLYDVLTWFGKSFRGTDADVLTRAATVRDFVTTFVRQPELYTVEHEEARVQWDDFVRQNYQELDMPEEPSSDRSEESGNTSEEYNDEEEDPAEEDSAQSSEAEDQDSEENLAETPELPSTAANPSESFASLGYVEANDKLGLIFDNALVSRLRFLNTGVEDSGAQVHESCTLNDITNYHHINSTRNGRDALGSNGMEEKVLAEEDTRSESIDREDNSSNDVVQGDARNFVFRNSVGRLEETTTTVKYEHDDYTIVESPRTDRNSEAETVIANPRGRRKRKSMEDSSEADDSDGSSSSDAPSIVCHLLYCMYRDIADHATRTYSSTRYFRKKVAQRDLEEG